MFDFILRQAQLYRCCIFHIFKTTVRFGCPDQTSSGRTWIHKNSKGERLLLTNSKYRVVI